MHVYIIMASFTCMHMHACMSYQGTLSYIIICCMRLRTSMHAVYIHHSFIYSFIHEFSCIVMHSFMHSFTHARMHIIPGYPFIHHHSYVECVCVHPCTLYVHVIHAFTHSFMHSCIHSCTHAHHTRVLFRTSSFICRMRVRAIISFMHALIITYQGTLS
jgi:hypothetical protein